jgi:lysophospholipase L1-like esterase
MIVSTFWADEILLVPTWIVSDHNKTVNKINKVNLELKKLCIRKKIQYTNLYRSFLLNNRPDSSLYAPRDGLHLNFAGTSLLRKKFINIIKHVSVN